MSNTHGTPDTLKEWQAIAGDLLPACLLTSTGLTPPGSGLTVTAASCTAYARSGPDLVYIDQPALSVTVPNVAGSHWLIAHRDTHSAVAGWTRRAGSHFLTQQAATQPTIPDGAVLAAQLTVAGGNITAVDTGPALNPPLSRQTADAVAITDGRISLGGHASTGVLDVQGSVASTTNTYYSTRLWPVAPTAATTVAGLQVEAATGAGLSTAGFAGLRVLAPPAGLLAAQGLTLEVPSGTSRWNVYASGTADNYFAGRVGIAMTGPLYPLDVTGQGRFSAAVGIATPPDGTAMLRISYNKSALAAVRLYPSGSDAGGGEALAFYNVGGGGIGSITTTASATAYNTSSDGRLKEAVTALQDALETVLALRPVQFRWKVDGTPGQGFIAQEAQAHVPQAVVGDPASPEPSMQMDLSKLVPHLVGAVKELAQQVQMLTARCARLEAR